VGKMSDYIKQLKDILVKELAKCYALGLKSANVMLILRQGKPEATIKDIGEYIIVTIEGKEYKYDKWYTKPVHLAKVLTNYFNPRCK